MPIGTQAQRPADSEKGYMRYNTTTNKFETYNGSNWVLIEGAGGDEDKDTTITQAGQNIIFVTNNIARMEILGTGDVSMGSNLYVHKNIDVQQDVSLNQRLFSDQHAEIGSLSSFNGNFEKDLSLNKDIQVNNNVFIDGKISSNVNSLMNTTDISSITFTSTSGSSALLGVNANNATFFQPGSTSSGDKFLGRGSNAYYGSSVAMTKDGNYIVSAGSGKVYVYKKIGTQYSLIKDGTNDWSLSVSNQALAISEDGTVVAVGLPSESSNTGGVYVYIYNTITSTWEYYGTNGTSNANTRIILGQTNSKFGSSLSLSDDGKILAVGAPGLYNSTTSNFVNIYTLTNNVWTQVGGSIQGTINSLFGYSVKLNSSGTKVCIVAERGIGTFTDPSSVYFSNVIQNGLLAWYKFNPSDGNEDSSGYGNDMQSMQSGLTFSTSNSENDPVNYYATGTAANNNKYGRITITNPVYYPRAPITISFWFRTTGGGAYTMLGYGNGANSGSAGMAFNLDYNNGTQNSYFALPNTWNSVSVTGLSNNTWYHYTATITNTFLATVYIDGVSRGTVQGTANFPVSYDFTVAQARDFARGYQGNIGDLRIYGHALSSTETANLYILSNRNANQTGIVRIYEYDATKTTANTDLSSNSFGPVGWNRIATDITGTLPNEQLGYAIDMNNEGNIVAVGTYQYSGKVKAYQVDLSYTTPLNTTIEQLKSEGAAYVVNESGSNKYIFNGNSSYQNYYGLGKQNYKITNIPSGHPMAIITPDPSNVTYNQIGGLITGDTADDGAGACALNEDGTVLIVGCYMSNSGVVTKQGQVKMYKLQPTDGFEQLSGRIQKPDSWAYMGQGYIDGATNNGYYGAYLDVNNKGDIFVATEYGYNSNYGRLLVYKYNSSSNTWASIDGSSGIRDDPSNTSRKLAKRVTQIDGSGEKVSCFNNANEVVIWKYDPTKPNDNFITSTSGSNGLVTAPSIHYGSSYWSVIGRISRDNGRKVFGRNAYDHGRVSASNSYSSTMSKNGQYVIRGGGIPYDIDDPYLMQTIKTYKYDDNFATDLSNSYQILNERTNVNVISSNGNKWTLNNNTTNFIENYGVSKGVYYLNNVSSSHPMAIIDDEPSFFTDWKVIGYLRNQDDIGNVLDHTRYNLAKFGTAFEFNDTGDVAVIGGWSSDHPNNSGSNMNRGIVFLIKKINGIWRRNTASEVYWNQNDQGGYQVSINGEGNIYAVSIPWAGNNRGRVQVYSLTNTTTDFGGGTRQLLFDSYDPQIHSVDTVYTGYSGVSLNKTGNTVVFSSYHFDENGTDSGKVWVYTGGSNIYNPWQLYGNTIIGNYGSLQYASGTASFIGDRLGQTPSINHKGNIIAAGCSKYKGTDAGFVTVYKYESSKTVGDEDEHSINFGPPSWKRLGNFIIGTNITATNNDGYRSKLNSDGNRIIVAERTNDDFGTSNHGKIKIYELTNTYSSSTGTSIEILNANSEVNVISSGGNKYTFNENTSYNKYYGISRGKYIFKNIPQSHPMAIINSKTTLAPVNANYRQIGQDIYNTSYGVQNFVSAMNKDGSVIAVQHNGTNNLGYVRVLEYIRGTWTQRGQVLQGHATNAYLGRHSISLNDDGTIIAMGYGSWSSSRGYVRIFQFFVPGLDGTAVGAWSELTTMNSTYGSELYGDSTNSTYGYSIQLNGAGNIIVIGERYFDATNSNSGRVRVYEYSLPGSVGGNWNQKGANHIFSSGTSRNIDQYGIPETNNYFGWDVKINRAGTIIAVASLKQVGKVVDFSSEGAIKTFAWTGTDWIEYGGGDQMNGDGDNHHMGITNDAGESGISMNHDGTIISAGSKEFSYAKVWKINDITNLFTNANGYTLKGSTITGPSANQLFGYSISINSDGTVVLITGDSGSGRARIYEWSGTAWSLKGSEITGGNSEGFGFDGAINGDGTVVAIGSRIYGGGNVGKASVYQWNGSGW